MTEHAIQAKGKGPVRLPPRRVSLAYAYKEKQAIEDMKAKGVIPLGWANLSCDKERWWSTPLCRLQKVNDLVKADGFPLPRVQDCLDAVAGSK